MQFYKTLSAIGFLRKSYAMKFLFTAFIGIHIPLIGIIFYLVLSDSGGISPLTLLFLTLGFTLAATAATLFVLNKLLNPVRLAEQALNGYLTNRHLPDFPPGFSDEVGSLLYAIRHTVESLEQANKTKMEMMYMITHDLRSPLSQILLLIELRKSGGVETEKFVEMVRMSTQNELDFIDSYIASLESDERNRELQKDTRISLKELVARSVTMVDTLRQNKQLEIRVHVAPELFVYTTRDLLLEHVIRNLLTNAIKFSYPKGVIEVHGQTTGTQTILSVKDSGIGFLPEQSEQLFTKFTPHKRVGTSGESTKGIGLYLTQKIVRQHNGTITATSEGKDKGAVFSVELSNDL
jgi:signal transduction histidine kinase